MTCERSPNSSFCNRNRTSKSLKNRRSCTPYVFGTLFDLNSWLPRVSWFLTLVLIMLRISVRHGALQVVTGQHDLLPHRQGSCLGKTPEWYELCRNTLLKGFFALSIFYCTPISARFSLASTIFAKKSSSSMLLDALLQRFSFSALQPALPAPQPHRTVFDEHVLVSHSRCSSAYKNVLI